MYAMRSRKRLCFALAYVAALLLLLSCKPSPNISTYGNYRSTKQKLVFSLGTPNSGGCDVRILALTENQNNGPVLQQYYTSTQCSAVANGLTSSGYTQVARLRSDQSSASDQGYFWMLSPDSPDGAPATDAGVYALDPNTLDIVASVATPGPIPLGIVVNHARTFAYATIQGVPSGETGVPAHPPEIVAISTATFSIAQTINLPQGANPGTPVLSPDDRYLYVPSDGISSGVFVVDMQNTASITAIPVTITDRNGNALPENVNQGVITPDGELLFVMESGSAGGGVYAFDTVTQQQTGRLILPPEQGNIQSTLALAIDPTGSRVYVLGAAGVGSQTTYTGYVTAFDTASLTQTGSVTLKQGIYPSSMGISLDGTTLFASDQNSSTIFGIDAVSLAVTEFDLPPAPPDPSGLPYAYSLLVIE